MGDRTATPRFERGLVLSLRKVVTSAISEIVLELHPPPARPSDHLVAVPCVNVCAVRARLFVVVLQRLRAERLAKHEFHGEICSTAAASVVRVCPSFTSPFAVTMRVGGSGRASGGREVVGNVAA